MNKRVKITSVVLEIFIGILLIEIYIFAIPLSLTAINLQEVNSNEKIDLYLETAVVLDGDSRPYEFIANISTEEDLDLIALNSSKQIVYRDVLDEKITQEKFNELLEDVYANASINEAYINKIKLSYGYAYYGAQISSSGNYIIVLTTGGQITHFVPLMLFIIMLIFCFVFLIGMAVCVMYIHSVSTRLYTIKDYVSSLPQNNYKNEYIDQGDDELRELSEQINEMRITIEKNEDAKEAMLQNVSHDLKTPIAVIRSYAEAIGDGIEDIEATQIIIAQANKLEKKVKQFIEYNKLEYLGDESSISAIEIKPIIEIIVNNCKHLSSRIAFECDLDDTKFVGKYENYYTICENIIDNALRYAKSLIRITLKQGVLIIYNDGKHIEQKFVDDGFKPYEKGSDGKFGLGMSIVARTLDVFYMQITPRNEEVGVSFIIQKKK